MAYTADRCAYRKYIVTVLFLLLRSLEAELRDQDAAQFLAQATNVADALRAHSNDGNAEFGWIFSFCAQILLQAITIPLIKILWLLHL